MTRHRGRIAPIKLILPGLNPHPASALLAGRDVAGPQRPRMGDGGLPAKTGDGSPGKGANPNGQGKGRQLCNTDDNRKRQRQERGPRNAPRRGGCSPGGACSARVSGARTRAIRRPVSSSGAGGAGATQTSPSPALPPAHRSQRRARRRQLKQQIRTVLVQRYPWGKAAQM